MDNLITAIRRIRVIIVTLGCTLLYFGISLLLSELNRLNQVADRLYHFKVYGGMLATWDSGGREAEVNNNSSAVDLRTWLRETHNVVPQFGVESFREDVGEMSWQGLLRALNRSIEGKNTVFLPLDKPCEIESIKDKITSFSTEGKVTEFKLLPRAKSARSAFEKVGVTEEGRAEVFLQLEDDTEVVRRFPFQGAFVSYQDELFKDRGKIEKRLADFDISLPIDFQDDELNNDAFWKGINYRIMPNMNINEQITYLRSESARKHPTIESVPLLNFKIGKNSVVYFCMVVLLGAFLQLIIYLERLLKVAESKKDFDEIYKSDLSFLYDSVSSSIWRRVIFLYLPTYAPALMLLGIYMTESVTNKWFDISAFVLFLGVMFFMIHRFDNINSELRSKMEDALSSSNKQGSQ